MDLNTFIVSWAAVLIVGYFLLGGRIDLGGKTSDGGLQTA